MIQKDALTVLKMGKNVLLVGKAGSGKTHVINEYVEYLQKHGVDASVTASTGIAATHVGGVTIHSWSGLGIKEYVTPFDLDSMEQRKHLWQRFKKARVLVIDEVSMLSAGMLDSVDMVLRHFKRNDQPFGGLQVVLCGDFFQLPPVTKNEQPNFAFTADAWRRLDLHVCYLTSQHRHDDTDLRDILDRIREGTLTSPMRARLESRVVEKPVSGVPLLFTHNADVDRINEEALLKLTGMAYPYVMKTKGKKNAVETIKKSILAQEQLILKKNAEVMFIKNNPVSGYANGTLGKVTSFKNGLPVVKTRGGKTINVDKESWTQMDNEAVVAEVTQLPLRLAWAITVHKSQGMTLDGACIDLSKAFIEGQGYVALSRVKSLNGLYLLGINEKALMVDPQMIAFDKRLQDLSEKNERRLSITPKEKITSLCEAFVEKNAEKKKS